MNAIKKARRLIAARSDSVSALTLARLVRALESEENFQLSDLYQLDYETFDLALDVLKEWRLDRYYMSKAKLHDIAVHLAQLRDEFGDAPIDERAGERDLREQIDQREGNSRA